MSTNPPPPPPRINNRDNPTGKRGGESRKRPWHPPTVKTVGLDETFTGPKRNSLNSEFVDYGVS